MPMLPPLKKIPYCLVQYDVRQVPTNLGVYMLDTVAKYYFSVSYKDITSFGRIKKILTGPLPEAHYLAAVFS